MSRIGKQPIPIPAGIEIHLKDGKLSVKGPKGTLAFTPHPLMEIKVESGVATVSRKSDERLDRSLHGLTRTLIFNMIEGVSKGFSKKM